MLSIDVLSVKPINTVNGQQIVDLTSSSISSPTQGTISFSNIAVCPTEFQMRPDLFSKLYTGDQDNMGLVLKLNSISNPFSLNAGDVLLIPSTNSMASLLAATPAAGSTTAATQDRISFRQQLASRISQVSPERQTYLSATSVSSANPTPMPPNIAGPGDQQFQVVNGKLIFGASIGVSRTANSNNTALANTKAIIAKKNLFS